MVRFTTFPLVVEFHSDFLFSSGTPDSNFSGTYENVSEQTQRYIQTGPGKQNKKSLEYSVRITANISNVPGPVPTQVSNPVARPHPRPPVRTNVVFAVVGTCLSAEPSWTVTVILFINHHLDIFVRSSDVTGAAENVAFQERTT